MIFLLPVEVQGIARFTLSTPAQESDATDHFENLAAQMNLQQHQRENPTLSTDYIVD